MIRLLSHTQSLSIVVKSTVLRGDSIQGLSPIHRVLLMPDFLIKRVAYLERVHCPGSDFEHFRKAVNSLSSIMKFHSKHFHQHQRRWKALHCGDRFQESRLKELWSFHLLLLRINKSTSQIWAVPGILLLNAVPGGEFYYKFPGGIRWKPVADTKFKGPKLADAPDRQWQDADK